jgi:AraC-like DNA-binding protein
MSGAFLPSLDLALRGGAAVLLLLLAGLLMRDHGRVWAARLGALFALGAAAFAVWTSPGLPHRADVTPLLALSAGNNVVFWLFARALFDDDFRPRPWHAAIWAGVVALALTCALVLQPGRSALAGPVDATLAVLALGFGLLAVVQTCASWSADLVERRRRLRVLVVGASAGYIVLNAASNLLGLGHAPAQVASLAAAAGLATIAAGVAWSFLGVAGGGSLFPAPDVARAALSADLQGLDQADRGLVAALERAMSFERAYREEGLTIGRLAHRHGVPEYRLRRLINQGLGHRNFNAFLNHYRIADAQAGLGDPAQAAVPILTIALDAGFNSLGPFNRAFKAETGMTPTAYRRRALDGGLDDTAIPTSAGRIPKSA